jgi:putative pantetheine hydrolase
MTYPALLRARVAAPVVLALLLAGVAVPGTAHAAQSGSAGPNNDITDVAGIQVGQWTDPAAHTGTTVVYLPATGTAGVDVRGGAAITRETDLLKPTNEVNKLNAVMLTGGGEYGLAAGPGVMQYLYEQEQGYQVGFTPDQVVPIVPGAAINDLRPGRNWKVRPGFDAGHQAAAAAMSAVTGPIAQGNVGAGAGAVAGGLKGGLGSASVQIAPGIVVAAVVVVDSEATPVDVGAGCGLLAARYGLANEFTAPKSGCGTYQAPAVKTGAVNRGGVIGVVATSVTLDKAMNQKVAEVAQDGITRALGRSHGMSAGDTMFSVSTDAVTPAVGVLPDCVHSPVRNSALGCQLLYQLLLSAAPEVVSRAIGHALMNAKSVPGLAPSYCDAIAGACGTSAAAAPTAPVVTQHAAVGRSDADGGPSMPSVPVLPLLLLGGVVLAFAAGRSLPTPKLRRGWGAAGVTALVLGAAATGSWAGTPSTPRLDDPTCQTNATCLALMDRVGESAKRAAARALAHAIIAAKDPTDPTASYCGKFVQACAPGGQNGYPKRSGKTGKYNNITDVPGIRVGAYTDPVSHSMGTTVIHAPGGAYVGVEVRGSAPGGRGTDANRSDNTMQAVDAVILTGGSAYGLAAADGVTKWLEEHGKGTVVDASAGIRQPLVPTSVIFDLGRFGRAWSVHALPDWGYKAIAAAKVGPLEQGTVGGGAGAQSGGSLKGGIGYASEDLGNGIVVGAVINVNAFGSAVDVGTGCSILGARYQIGQEFGSLKVPGDCAGFTGSPVAASDGKNTTIGVVATNVPMSRALLSKMAQFGQDGLAAALRPSHTYFDGDTIWAMSTGGVTRSAVTPASTTATGGTPRSSGAGGGTLPATGMRAGLAGGGMLLLLLAALAGRRVRVRAT